MWRKLIARYLLLARAILPLLRHTRGAARGRRKSPRRLLGLGSAAFSPFYCDKNPDGERPAFWKTGFRLLVMGEAERHDGNENAHILFRCSKSQTTSLSLISFCRTLTSRLPQQAPSVPGRSRCYCCRVAAHLGSRVSVAIGPSDSVSAMHVDVKSFR